jgi:hypothetical protein
MTLCGGTNSRDYGAQRYVCGAHREKRCDIALGFTRALAEESIVTPLRDTRLNDEKFLRAVADLKKSADKNSSQDCASLGAAIGADHVRQAGFRSGDARASNRESSPDDAAAALERRVPAIESVVAAGAMFTRDGAAHVTREYRTTRHRMQRMQSAYGLRWRGPRLT